MAIIMSILPLDGILANCRVARSIQFAGNHLYSYVERHCESKILCLKAEHSQHSNQECSIFESTILTTVGGQAI